MHKQTATKTFLGVAKWCQLFFILRKWEFVIRFRRHMFKLQYYKNCAYYYIQFFHFQSSLKLFRVNLIYLIFNWRLTHMTKRLNFYRFEKRFYGLLYTHYCFGRNHHQQEVKSTNRNRRSCT